MDKGVHTFPKGISPKVNVIVRLKFELTYNGVTVQHVSHYTTETHLHDPWSPLRHRQFCGQSFQTLTDSFLLNFDDNRCRQYDVTVSNNSTSTRAGRFFYCRLIQVSFFFCFFLFICFCIFFFFAIFFFFQIWLFINYLSYSVINLHVFFSFCFVVFWLLPLNETNRVTWYKIIVDIKLTHLKSEERLIPTSVNAVGWRVTTFLRTWSLIMYLKKTKKQWANDRDNRGSPWGTIPINP